MMIDDWKVSRNRITTDELYIAKMMDYYDFYYTYDLTHNIFTDIPTHKSVFQDIILLNLHQSMMLRQRLNHTFFGWENNIWNV